MLKSVDPIMSAPLLAAVDRAKAGRWIAISSLDASRIRGIRSNASAERLAAALFPLLQVSAHTPSPLVGWLADPSDEASLDAFYSVQGTARDAERRTFEMQNLPTLPEGIWEDVDAIITVDSIADFVFFVCVGGAPHTAIDITRSRIQRAA